tara:strand:- start:142 stop:588 length:447 start_codon:yes stop_codon:yes gene_type:complete
MGTAIYVYETEKEYLKIYNRMDKEVMFSAPILDIFLKPDKKLWVVSKVTKNKERPQLGRSIVNFVNGTVFEYSNGDERPILKNSVVFNPKKGRVEFFPKKLREAELWIRVDRFYGMPPKGKVVLDQSKRFYDVSRDRINFIVKNKDGI